MIAVWEFAWPVYRVWHVSVVWTLYFNLLHMNTYSALNLSFSSSPGVDGTSEEYLFLSLSVSIPCLCCVTEVLQGYQGVRNVARRTTGSHDSALFLHQCQRSLPFLFIVQ